MKTVIVGMGLIVNDQRQILMGLRSAGGSRPSMWEIPGGRLEPGETIEQAIVRELREELGVEVEVGTYIAEMTLNLEARFQLHCHAVYIVSGEPRPITAVQLMWTTIDYAIVNLPCVPSTYTFYKPISEYLEKIKEITG